MVVVAEAPSGAREQHPDAFLDAPGGADLAGGVVVSEDAVEALHGTFGQLVPGTEQKHAVGLGQVVLAPMALGQQEVKSAQRVGGRCPLPGDVRQPTMRNARQMGLSAHRAYHLEV